MRRQSNTQSLDRVYRQFSRQRYKKYRSQFPKLYESDIVVKIIRQWESMNSEERQTLGAHYIERNFITAEEEKSNSNPSSLAQKTPAKDTKMHLMNTTDSKPRGSSIKKLQRVSRFIEEESEFNRYSDRPSGNSHSEPSSPKAMDRELFNNKSRCGNHRNYINFYKFYYRKLSIEHKRWHSAKISQIIKLLWKREQLRSKAQKTKKISKLSSILPKVRSPKTEFRKRKVREGYSSKLINSMWKHLPKDTRIFMRHPIPEQNSLHQFLVKYQAGESMNSEEETNPIAIYIHKKME